MSKLRIIVFLAEYNEKWIDTGKYEYEYTPINYVICTLNTLGSVKAMRYRDRYKIIIKSKLKKNDLKKKVLDFFATDSKLLKGCIIDKIN